jgi:eukaryotic-like serine/threonine-protein kinase
VQEVFLTLPNGAIIRDRYVIEDLLGKGGFGSVYLVRDKRVKGNLFALKEVVDPSKQERDRFTLECEILRRLDHPALPHVYRAFGDDAVYRAYMLMDYIEGPNLEVLRQRQPGRRLPLSHVITIIAPIIAAISYLHSQQAPIIHRDIKPANIIVSSTGEEAVLVDFGIAKEYEPDSTTTTVRRCSPGYGAPEQYSGGTDTRTDIYGMAATLYSVLSGRVPVDAFQRMMQLGSKGVDPLIPLNEHVPEIPPSVSLAIARALAINSTDRFASIEEFWQALRADVPAEVQHSESGLQAVAFSVIPAACASPCSPIEPLEAGEDAPAEERAGSAQAAQAIAAASAVQAVTLGATRIARRNTPLTPVLTPALASWQEPTFRLVKVPGFVFPRKSLAAALCLLVLMVGLGMASSYWFYSGQHTHPSNVNHGSAPHTLRAALTQVTVHMPTPPAPTPGVTTTTSPHGGQNVPILAGTYQGTLTDTATYQYSHMMVVITQVAGHATFNGRITLYRVLGKITFSFSGVVDGEDNFTFTISPPHEQEPLHFYGVVQNGVYLHGNFCSGATNHCSQNSGYFTVGPRY